MKTYEIEVDSPVSRADDWEDYCNETDGPLPYSIRSGGAEDRIETWLVTARTAREALARARATARRLKVNVLTLGGARSYFLV